MLHKNDRKTHGEKIPLDNNIISCYNTFGERKNEIIKIKKSSINRKRNKKQQQQVGAGMREFLVEILLALTVFLLIFQFSLNFIKISKAIF